jgi:ankyrin repeat protein
LISHDLLPIDMPDYNGCTALHWACLDGSYDVVKYLLAENANINAVTYEARSTPLHVAIQALEYGN